MYTFLNELKNITIQYELQEYEQVSTFQIDYAKYHGWPYFILPQIKNNRVYFTIDNLISLDDFLKHVPTNTVSTISLLQTLVRVWKHLENTLLLGENIILNPKCIFLRPENDHLHNLVFLYLPISRLVTNIEETKSVLPYDRSAADRILLFELLILQLEKEGSYSTEAINTLKLAACENIDAISQAIETLPAKTPAPTPIPVDATKSINSALLVYIIQIALPIIAGIFLYLYLGYFSKVFLVGVLLYAALCFVIDYRLLAFKTEKTSSVPHFAYLILANDMKKKKHFITEDDYIIGRDKKTTHLTIQDEALLTKHAFISRKEGQYYINPVSNASCSINGRLLSKNIPTPLPTSCDIELGKTKLLFHGEM